MEKKKYYISGMLYLVLLLGMGACREAAEVPDRDRPPLEGITALPLLPADANTGEIRADPSVEYQVMENFGASDCWTVQMVGQWPEEKKEQMARWLFSMDTLDSGQPAGIGLSAWRFNIGAGSAEQGEASQIGDPLRRATCFMSADGSYDWNKQPGQQWFLRTAHEHGVPTLIGFSNSPPVHFTRNGLAHGDSKEKSNLSHDQSEAFAAFLATVAEGLKRETGIELDYISPVNEPQWDWTDGGQEGCHMTNLQVRDVTRFLDSELEKRPALETRILLAEAGEWDYLFEKGEVNGDQIDYFFGGERNPLHLTTRMEYAISAHSYYTTHPHVTLVQTRQQAWNKASEYPGLRLWSTEYCPLGNADLQQLGWSGWRKDLGMDVALHMGRILHHDLVDARVSAWQWWLGISSYDYPDGLIYVNGNEEDGTFTDSRIMWTLGNYSRFIRPGARRIRAESEWKELLVTAFIDRERATFTVVMLNTSKEELPAHVQLPGLEGLVFKPYISSDAVGHKLAPLEEISSDQKFEIPARSAITFVARIP